MKKHLASLAFLFLASMAVLSQTRDVEEIKITSSWGGLGTPQKHTLIIRNKPKGFYVKGKKIDKRLIEDLLNAINEPELKQFTNINLGITQNWLTAHAESGVKEYAYYYYTSAAPNQKALYLSTFRNLEYVERILPRLLNGGWTDDYPSVRIKIKKRNQENVEIESSEQPMFMLPWKIIENDKTRNTYNANISRALANLLPKKFTNRNRLSGADLELELAKFVIRDIQDEWRFLDVRNKARTIIDELNKSYAIQSGEVNANHGVDFGESWERNKSPQKNLHLLLQNEYFPKNFAIRLKLPFRDEKVDNLDVFQNKINKYTELVFSISWLKKYLESEKGKIELRFISNLSFSNKALEKFKADMTGIGRGDLIAEVEKRQNEIVLIGVGGGLEYYQSYWIILPDRKTILWRYRYPRLFDWTEKDFTSGECTDRIAAGLKCVGAVISPNGTIKKNP